MLGAGRRTLAPQPVDQDIARHRLVRIEQEEREQRAQFPATHVKHAAIDGGLDGPQQPIFDHRGGPLNAQSKRSAEFTANGDGDGSLIVSVINGRRCNATRTSGCHAVQEIPVGSQPGDLVVSPGTSTVYVSSSGSLVIVKIKNSATR